MGASGIPQRVEDLLAKHIHSVEQLEALLLLQRDPSREWTAAEVSGELVTQESSVASRLEDLAGRGLVACVGGSPPRYRFEPRDPREAAAVAELRDVYGKRRVTVIGLIFSKPSDVVQTFADAFRLRKDD